MTLRLPGSILILDDTIKEIQQLRRSLALSGHGTILVDTLDIPDDFSPRNVRLAIIDLRISRHPEMTENDKEVICKILHAIDSRSRLFLYVIWSDLIGADPDPWYVEQLTAHYRSQYGADQLPGLLIDVKGKTHTDYLQLISEIEQFLATRPVIGLIFEWERLIDEARDHATDFLNRSTELGFWMLIFSLLEEFKDKHTATREAVGILNGILLDCVQRGLPDYAGTSEVLLGKIAELNNPRNLASEILETLVNQFGWLYSRFAYGFCRNVRSWTGDIHHFPKNRYSREFAVIVSPMCDMARDAPKEVKIIYGARIRPKLEEMKKLISEMEDAFPNGDNTTVAQAIRFFTGESRNDKLHPLPFVPIETSLEHILLDLSTIQDISSSKLNEDDRIWRLNRPFVDKLTARLDNPDTRIGSFEVPSIVRKYIRSKTKSELGI